MIFRHKRRERIKGRALRDGGSVLKSFIGMFGEGYGDRMAYKSDLSTFNGT